jgi:hypothetical protein
MFTVHLNGTTLLHALTSTSPASLRRAVVVRPGLVSPCALHRAYDVTCSPSRAGCRVPHRHRTRIAIHMNLGYSSEHIERRELTSTIEYGETYMSLVRKRHMSHLLMTPPESAALPNI